jgi:hypothetical protein
MKKKIFLLEWKHLRLRTFIYVHLFMKANNCFKSKISRNSNKISTHHQQLGVQSKLESPRKGESEITNEISNQPIN